MLDKELYTKILASVPVLTVDLIIQDSKRDYLLVKRKNEPLKDQYFVPGGRILKGESPFVAAARKLKEETGLDAPYYDLIGIYSDTFKENEYGLDYIHTVSVVIQPKYWYGEIKLDDQSSDFIWSDKLPEKFNVIRI